MNRLIGLLLLTFLFEAPAVSLANGAAAEVSVNRKIGGSDSGGGNFLARKFQNVAREVSQDLATNQIRYAATRAIPLEKLMGIVYRLTVDVTHDKILGSEGEYSAWTENARVSLYRPDWEGVDSASRDFRKMVIHELLRGVGVPDGDYQASDQLDDAVEAIRSFNFDDYKAGRLRKIRPSKNGIVFCEGGVGVTCGPAAGSMAFGGPLSVLGPDGQLNYLGKCYDAVISCQDGPLWK